MQTTETTAQTGQVVQLGTHDQPRTSRGFWRDAWRRLRRNKLALIGIAVILLNIVIALFAPLIAPKTFDEQVRDENNAAPQWVASLFPTMKLFQEDNWSFEGKAGDTIAVSMTSADLDSMVMLIGPEDNILKTGQKKVVTIGQPPDLGSYIEKYTLPQDGTYHLKARAANFGIKGTYLLTLYTGEAASQVSIAPAPPGTQVAAVTPPDPTTICPSELEGIRPCGTLAAEQPVGGYIAGDGYVKMTTMNKYPLGSDSLGRDLLSRIIYGARISLAVAFVGPFVSLIVGLVLGLVSGYMGGRTDNLLMRLVDIMYAFPTILFVILLMAYFRASGQAVEEGSLVAKLNEVDAYFGGMMFIFIGIGLTSWMQTTRLTRAQVLSVRAKEYIESAVSIGTSTPSIIFRHVLPNILGPIVVAETLTIPAYISYEAFLSFIGLGVNRPTPSWGAMISDGSVAISSYPNQAIFPALALFFIMFAFNFLGDGLRDALDPRSGG